MVLRVDLRFVREAAKIGMLPYWQRAGLLGVGCSVDWCHNGSWCVFKFIC